MLRAVSLEDSYAQTEGTVFLTGTQALVRGLLDQAHRDREGGLRVGTLISGYPGSPLGGFDTTIARASRFLQPADIHHVPGVNEELAASAVMGSQMLELFPPGGFDGVTGVWYGKAPGVDRSGDVFRHGNFAGSPEHCGALALCGDDPAAKSSTLPTQSEYALVNAGMPVLYPSSVEEFHRYTVHGINLSRFAGVWTGLKLVTNLCDGGATVAVSPGEPQVRLPELHTDGQPFAKPSSFMLNVHPAPLEFERTLFTERLPAAQAYARLNGLDQIAQHGDSDRLGIVAAGKAWTDVAQSLDDLGLDERALARLGIRRFKPGMIYPLAPESAREFAAGLEEIIVIEEKRGFVEEQLKDVLYGRADAPGIVGKRDVDGSTLFPLYGELDPDAISERLGPRLLSAAQRCGDDELAAAISRRLETIRNIRARDAGPAMPVRVPNYCSGCPHNRSTIAVDGMTAGGGIGCHGMASIMSQPERQILSMVPMGSEGATWAGAAPFTSREHFVQNVGDGTFFHSGSQALRAAVAADVNITFRILWNKAVAMTGGQDVTGHHEVPALTRSLEAEGVRRTIVVAEEPERYRDLGPLAGNAKLVDRDRYADSMRELATVPGVTALIFDQQCAAEKRRLRKRGKLPSPDKYVVINEDVCEGCGDCGAKSNCPSVQPVDTEFGRKTQIEQSSCNADYSCLEGDCPSFLTVYSAQGYKPRATGALPDGLDDLPEPQLPGSTAAYHVYLPGIGGTGVTTANQLLAYAALMEGRHVATLDQTGLAQKGGAVLSNVVISDEALSERSNRVGLGAADLLLAADPLSAASAGNLDRCHPSRTRVVGNLAVTPTGEMIRHVDRVVPEGEALRTTLDQHTRAEGNVWIDANALAHTYFGDHMPANTILLGAAYQAGALPLRADSIEAAIGLNGVAVEKTVAAFRIGRLAVADPARLDGGDTERPRTAEDEQERALDDFGATTGRGRAYRGLLSRCAHLDEESRRLLAIRIASLMRYQDADYAARYVEGVLAVADREQHVVPGTRDLTHAAIAFLYKLMAYKDEYEVPRLLLQQEWDERIASGFGDATFRYNLHPPVLRALGYDRKIELGRWARPGLRALAAMRRVRGTRWDLFGRTAMRRRERELITWYEQLLAEIVDALTPHNHQVAVLLARTPDRIRGYEDVKLRTIEDARAFVDEHRPRLRALPVVA